jgi:hypothetical protein
VAVCFIGGGNRRTRRNPQTYGLTLSFRCIRQWHHWRATSIYGNTTLTKCKLRSSKHAMLVVVTYFLSEANILLYEGTSALYLNIQPYATEVSDKAWYIGHGDKRGIKETVVRFVCILGYLEVSTESLADSLLHYTGISGSSFHNAVYSESLLYHVHSINRWLSFYGV